MDNQSLQKIKDALSKSNNIGVVVGRDPSVDEMASALSLYLLLSGVNKKVTVASPTDPIVELSSLVGINKVQRTLGGDAGDLVVSFPYIEGEIEKVSYTLEEGFLNIIVKASEQGLSFDEKDVNYVRGSGSIDLLFVVGTPRLSDLEGVFDAQKLRDVRIINIDNKESNQQFGDIVLVSPRFSSVSEQIADLVLALGFQLNQDVAQNLLSGITFATKNFQDPNTTSVAFEIASLLLKRGAKRVSRVSAGEMEEKREKPQSTQSNRSWLDELASREDQAVNDTDASDSPVRAGQGGQARRSQDTRQPRDTQAAGQARQDENRSQVQEAHVKDDRPENPKADDSTDEPPLDWLTPKVYKGSSDV